MAETIHDRLRILFSSKAQEDEKDLAYQDARRAQARQDLQILNAQKAQDLSAAREARLADQFEYEKSIRPSTSDIAADRDLSRRMKEAQILNYQNYSGKTPELAGSIVAAEQRERFMAPWLLKQKNPEALDEYNKSLGRNTMTAEEQIDFERKKYAARYAGRYAEKFKSDNLARNEKIKAEAMPRFSDILSKANPENKSSLAKNLTSSEIGLNSKFNAKFGGFVWSETPDMYAALASWYTPLSSRYVPLEGRIPGMLWGHTVAGRYILDKVTGEIVEFSRKEAERLSSYKDPVEDDFPLIHMRE